MDGDLSCAGMMAIKIHTQGATKITVMLSTKRKAKRHDEIRVPERISAMLSARKEMRLKNRQRSASLEHFQEYCSRFRKGPTAGRAVRGWKPHLRKWECAIYWEVRHLAAQEKDARLECGWKPHLPERPARRSGHGCGHIFSSFARMWSSAWGQPLPWWR